MDHSIYSVYKGMCNIAFIDKIVSLLIKLCWVFEILYFVIEFVFDVWMYISCFLSTPNLSFYQLWLKFLHFPKLFS